MQNRWVVLALLFVVRAAMGVQFQSVPALSVLYVDQYMIDLATLGFLVALYLTPGIVIAIPGGALAARIGDKQIVTLGLVLMGVGGALMALLPIWEVQVLGRALAGIGAVFLNVILSKMVAETFAGREVATAMGVFVNSWPLGLALGLLILPAAAENGALETALWVSTAIVVAVLAVFVVFYRPVTTPAGAGPVVRTPLRGAVLGAAISAGAVWGLFNAAFGILFSFGATLLNERGFGLTQATAALSVVFWAAAISTPLGGFVADRTGRRDLMLVLVTVGFGITLSLSAEVSSPYILFALVGFISCLAAGPIMSLPAQVLTPGNSSLGMGVFFTVYYVAIAIGPILAGAVADALGTARAAFHFGTGMLVLTLLAFGAFQIFAAKVTAAQKV